MVPSWKMSDMSTNLCYLLSIWNNIEKYWKIYSSTRCQLRTLPQFGVNYLKRLLPIERLCNDSPSTHVLSTMSSSTVSDLWVHDRCFGCSPIGSNHLRGFFWCRPNWDRTPNGYCTITLHRKLTLAPENRPGSERTFHLPRKTLPLHDLFFPRAGFQMFQAILTSVTKNLYYVVGLLYLSVS